MEIIYKSKDGKTFKTEEECKKHDEKYHKLVKYWRIDHTADENETGMCIHRTYIKTIWEGFPAHQGENEYLILQDYCFNKFGKKTAWVQGVAPCSNWGIYKITKEDFKNHSPIMWGGSPTKTYVITLGVGYRDKIHTLSEESY